MSADQVSKITLANDANKRYSKSLQEIERIKNGIYHNRKGQLPLTEIDSNPAMVTKRVLREGLPYDKAIERINGTPDFQDVFILEKILRISSSVCRINIITPFGSSGYGTGFLIAPNLLLTNNHVLPDMDTARNSFAQFNYQLNEQKRAVTPINFQIQPDQFFITSDLEKKESDPYSGLDFTVVAVNDVSEDGVSLNKFGHVRLDENLGKVLEGENCVVVQHPSGDYKKVVIRDTRMITLVDDFLIYESDTLPGSSGSVVIGLGTGEVIALHHSGVPRRNEKGQWLRRDGTPVQPGDGDHQIDWLGNEGIRVSSIIKAVRKIPIADSMEPVREQLLTNIKLATAAPVEDIKIAKMPTINSKDSITRMPEMPTNTPAQTLYFEVAINNNESFIDDWIQNAASYVPGLKDNERLFPYSTDERQRKLFYISVETDQNPWHFAAYLEGLPHIASVTPDLPVQTDVGVSQQKAAVQQLESGFKDVIFDDGTAEWNEENFIKNWSISKCYVEATKDPQRKDYFRQWNWVAVNFPGQKIKFESEEWKTISTNLKILKLTQLDTGYSSHSKIKDGIDFTLDMDFIGNDNDAKDEHDGFFFKHPNHGTRTASLIVGGKMEQGAFQYDGNRGLLNPDTKPLIKLIPYRIAKSVILIGRGRDLVAAAQHAVNNQTDVMFICMGSYPRPMIEEVVRYAYQRGVIWICAAGNEVEVVVAPALYPGTIAVAGINPDLKPWKGSSNGPAVDIAAPGESVYVPFWDKEGNEIMCYGNGTSYATPHVAAAAMLWKAKHYNQLKEKYNQPWQVVEAFRECLKNSATTIEGWKEDKYGKGILNVENLLSIDLPPAESLKNAYAGKKSNSEIDLGVKETVHYIWNTLRRKLTPGSEEALSSEMALTYRGQTALQVLTNSTRSATEAVVPMLTETQKKEILTAFFENQP